MNADTQSQSQSQVTSQMQSRQDTGNKMQQQQRPGEPDLESMRGYIVPPANIIAAKDEYIVEVEMPGVNKDGLEVTVEGNELTIVGRRTLDIPDGELWYAESPMADYRRVFELGPDIDPIRISAEMKQGVLNLHLPKSERARPKQIEVKVD